MTSSEQHSSLLILCNFRCSSGFCGSVGDCQGNASRCKVREQVTLCLNAHIVLLNDFKKVTKPKRQVYIETNKDLEKKKENVVTSESPVVSQNNSE